MAACARLRERVHQPQQPQQPQREHITDHARVGDRVGDVHHRRHADGDDGDKGVEVVLERRRILTPTERSQLQAHLDQECAGEAELDDVPERVCRINGVRRRANEVAHRGACTHARTHEGGGGVARARIWRRVRLRSRFACGAPGTPSRSVLSEPLSSMLNSSATSATALSSSRKSSATSKYGDRTTASRRRMHAERASEGQQRSSHGSACALRNEMRSVSQMAPNSACDACEGMLRRPRRKRGLRGARERLWDGAAPRR